MLFHQLRGAGIVTTPAQGGQGFKKLARIARSVGVVAGFALAIGHRLVDHLLAEAFGLLSVTTIAELRALGFQQLSIRRAVRIMASRAFSCFHRGVLIALRELLLLVGMTLQAELSLGRREQPGLIAGVGKVAIGARSLGRRVTYLRAHPGKDFGVTGIAQARFPGLDQADVIRGVRVVTGGAVSSLKRHVHTIPMGVFLLFRVAIQTESPLGLGQKPQLPRGVRPVTALASHGRYPGVRILQITDGRPDRLMTGKA
jgi:hypothetical protein